MTATIKTIATAKNGSYACELFVKDEEGNYVSKGFAVFSADGDLLHNCSTSAEAIRFIAALDEEHGADRKRGFDSPK